MTLVQPTQHVLGHQEEKKRRKDVPDVFFANATRKRDGKGNGVT
jgi:hypothetical protein